MKLFSVIIADASNFDCVPAWFKGVCQVGISFCFLHFSMPRGLTGLAKSYRCDVLPPRPEGVELIQHNLVLVVNFGKIMHVLAQLAKCSIHCSRKIGTFPQVQKSSINPRLTEMTFLSGPEVIVGPEWLYAALYAALKKRIWLEKIRRRYFPDISKDSLVFGKPVNANLVFTAHLPGKFYDIAAFAANVQGVKYEPLRFPGANITIFDPDGKPISKVMVFERGYINLMGCRSLVQATYALSVFLEIIAPFACEPKNPTSDIVGQREREKTIAISKVIKELKSTDNSFFVHSLTDQEENLKKVGVEKSALEICEEYPDTIID